MTVASRQFMVMGVFRLQKANGTQPGPGRSCRDLRQRCRDRVYSGVRSIELDHREVVGLLHDIVGETAAAAGRHVSRVIAKKDLVEYDCRSDNT